MRRWDRLTRRRAAGNGHRQPAGRAAPAPPGRAAGPLTACRALRSRAPGWRALASGSLRGAPPPHPRAGGRRRPPAPPAPGLRPGPRRKVAFLAGRPRCHARAAVGGGPSQRHGCCRARRAVTPVGLAGRLAPAPPGGGRWPSVACGTPGPRAPGARRWPPPEGGVPGGTAGVSCPRRGRGVAGPVGRLLPGRACRHPRGARDAAIGRRRADGGRQAPRGGPGVGRRSTAARSEACSTAAIARDGRGLWGFQRCCWRTFAGSHAAKDRVASEPSCGYHLR